MKHKYFLETVDGLRYVRGKCSPTVVDSDYINNGFSIFESDFDCGSVLLERLEGGLSVRKWKVEDDGKIIPAPYQTEVEINVSKTTSYEKNLSVAYSLEKRLELIEAAIDKLAKDIEAKSLDSKYVVSLPQEFTDYINSKTQLKTEIFSEVADGK